MDECQKTGIADIAGFSQQKALSNCAEKEARILTWVFTPEQARNHIDLNLERTKDVTGDDTHEFWLAVESAFEAIEQGKTDEVDELIHLLRFVNELKPREKWIVPLLKDTPFQDLRSQLFAIVEDYKKR